MKVINNIIGLLILLITVLTYASSKTIGVLDFELIDTTIKIDTHSDAQEEARTKLIKPLLAKALASFTSSGYKVKLIDYQLQSKMNQGVGYIYSHPDVAAELGQKVDADYIVVGRLHKPSYLFAYLIVRIVDVKQAKVVAHHVVEAKGKSMQATRKSIPNLAMKIAQTIQ